MAAIFTLRNGYSNYKEDLRVLTGVAMNYFTLYINVEMLAAACLPRERSTSTSLSLGLLGWGSWGQLPGRDGDIDVIYLLVAAITNGSVA